MKSMISVSLLLLGGILAAAPAAAMDRTDKCLDFINKSYYYTVDSIIRDWEKDSVLGPEYYVVKMNYFVKRAGAGTLRIDKNAPKHGEKFAMKNQTTGEVYYLFDNDRYDPIYIDSAVKYVSAGISRYPLRLDMRFGLAYTFQQIGDVDAQVKTLSSAIEYARAHPDSMLWSKNMPRTNIDSFLVESLHSYALFYWRSEEDAKYLKIARLHASYFPNSVIGNNDLGNYYAVTKQWRKALAHYQKAHELDHHDMIVANNIAHAYLNLRDIANARSYYQFVADSAADGEQRRLARERLDSLRAMRTKHK